MQNTLPLKFADERSETLRLKLGRALLGAWYGLLAGTAFTLVAMFSDRLLFSHLPMGLDWDFYTTFWAWLGPGLMLVGFLSAWWFETWAGLLTGTLAAAAILILSNLPYSAANLFQKVITFVIIFLPAMAICLPIVYFFRWLVKQSLRFWSQPGGAWRVAALFLLVIGLGGAGGIWMRMPAKAVSAVTKMEAALQATPEPGSALLKLSRLDAHHSQSFELFYAKSTYTTQGYDVRAVYEDGYAVTCAIVVYGDSPPFITKCEESRP
ncbi:MAG: hypothetical protein Fur0016_12580 [Anaerolineales bacterium]